MLRGRRRWKLFSSGWMGRGLIVGGGVGHENVVAEHK